MCNSTSLTQEELDALVAVSERYHASHERRVGHELQVVIACLAFFGAAAAFRLSTSFGANSNQYFFLGCVASFLALCLFATVYLTTSAASNTLDLEKARAADKRILEFIKAKLESASTGNLDKQSPSLNRWVWEIVIVWGGALDSTFMIMGSM